MKKIISLIFCIALLTLLLVSCGDEELHVHQYDRDKWVYDDNSHWYAAACDCSDAGVISAAAHVDSMNDGYCDICGYLKCTNTDPNAPGAYSTEYQSNANAHWLAPTCGHSGQNSHIDPKDFSAHVYDAEGLGKCLVCNYQCAETENEEAWTHNNGSTHWHAPVCGHVGHNPITDESEHVDKDKNEAGEEVGDGVCDLCGYVMCQVPVREKGESDDAYNARLEAFYKSEISYDETNHWYDPKCSHVGHKLKDIAPHADDAENPDGKCDTCDYPMGE